MVESVYGIPAAAAARATPTSANGQPKPMPPVGPTAIGSFERAPRIAADVSIRATPASVFGASRTRSNAARLSASVVSSSAGAVEEIEYSARQALFREPAQIPRCSTRAARTRPRPRETGQEDSAGAAASDPALRSPLAALIRPSLRRF